MSDSISTPFAIRRAQFVMAQDAGVAIAEHLLEFAHDAKLILGPVMWAEKQWFFMVVGCSSAPWVRAYGGDTAEETEELFIQLKKALASRRLALVCVDDELVLAKVAASIWPHPATTTVRDRLQAKHELWATSPTRPC